MSKWFIALTTTAVFIIAIIITLCVTFKKDESVNAEDSLTDTNFEEVYELSNINVTLNIGESYTLDLSNIPNEYTYSVGMMSTNDCCTISDLTIVAVKTGESIIKVKYFSSNTDYIVQDINVVVENAVTTFNYTMTRKDVNKFTFSIEDTLMFNFDLFSVKYDETKLTLSNIQANSFDATISDNTEIYLCYAGKEFYNVALNLDFTLLDYDVIIGDKATDTYTLYLVENESYSWYNSLSVQIKTTGLLEDLFSLNADLSNNGMSVTADKLGYFDVNILYNGVSVDVIKVNVIEPPVTDIIVEEKIEIGINESYTFNYIVEPSAYIFQVDIECEDKNASINGNVFKADKAGEYTVKLSVNNYVEYVTIIVTEQDITVPTFNLVDRKGIIIEEHYTLASGVNYFTIITDADFFYFTLNNEKLDCSSDFVVINTEKVGNYILNVYTSENCLLKTYYLQFLG